MDKRLLDVNELSGYLGLPKATIYTWTHQRKIPHVKFGRTVRFDKVEIDDWVENRRIGAKSFAR